MAKIWHAWELAEHLEKDQSDEQPGERERLLASIAKHGANHVGDGAHVTMLRWQLAQHLRSA